ncbi:MAG: 2-oxoglutarate dehydrogenase E1 component [Gammaproteobacteria bacterium RIFCSPLOWO2_02_FULL_47_50]|nr:MAG: 2-oxoglutarate dehydrogenase E1 component [Gammaproteobacteria bacterium RIFCSPLOWO2_12_47_11]OGT78546.1 MAG: 2-oxoglutarate dehydrogenase E1 component [Gammaproteobacteria bacterium RIFCSPLOWO2_02_FULL_47_50]OGT83426.1 MAG: 2-oxoglutarate dehydrogenase E1 component [Gammaproteobacteria bacterium RIFCSPLOWO2_12_FULL_47_76]
MDKISTSCLYSGNAWFIEDLYEAWLANPASIAPEWRQYFDTLSKNDPDPGKDIAHSPIQRAFLESARQTTSAAKVKPAGSSTVDPQKQVAVLQLINAYRFRGHRQADLDPLKQYERPVVPELDPAYHGLTDADLDKKFNTGSLQSTDAENSLREILEIIQTTYCRTIGAEYMHINETEQKRWIQQRLEPCRATPEFSKDKKLRILERIIAANALEEYLHTKYVGQKRFSLEGGEPLIPLLDELIQDSGNRQVKEVVIGMAHRGRVNVLVNTIGKLPSDLFSEFEGKGKANENSSGDVKYHLGYSSDIETPGGPIHLTLSFNPSHLEIIDPVVEGSVRARQDRRKDHARNQILPVLLHGDAAFAGQGVVMETFNLSQTRGYTTGGTVHIIINNQIGFTTSDPLDSRSTLYCTDVAKTVQAPIFHVNADDPEAVVFIAKLALDFRMEFNKDVVIDMVCYRKHGHSEADEPAATQPVMYKQIRKHPGARKLYTEKLISENIITPQDPDRLLDNYIQSLENNRAVAGPQATNVSRDFLIDFSPYKGTRWDMVINSNINSETLKRLAERITCIPDNIKLHPTVQRIIESRIKMSTGELPMDWGFAETMAYASLLDAGHPIRLSGQDSGRGTFFHRHAVIHDQETGDTYLPLQHIRDKQANFLVINSTLSEEAVLAYEYGYSSAEPNSLVIWEAQFGDFANGAQVVFDQFISSCEAKWGRYCGLVVLLPHGYDGQGPEHSSARLERYLQLCAEENMQVCVPSTAGQMFHMLRRQVMRPYRKPLIVMSPKSLLRHKLSTTPIDDILTGRFQTVIDEIDNIDHSAITRLLFCSGKVYYDLLEARRGNNIQNIAIARIEQLFPFPADAVKRVISQYENLQEIVWVQEEPKNQGSWYYMQSRGTMIGCINEHHTFGYAGRFYSASPAVGYMSKHLEQQQQLVANALQIDKLEVTHRKNVLHA